MLQVGWIRRHGNDMVFRIRRQLSSQLTVVCSQDQRVATPLADPLRQAEGRCNRVPFISDLLKLSGCARLVSETVNHTVKCDDEQPAVRRQNCVYLTGDSLETIRILQRRSSQDNSLPEPRLAVPDHLLVLVSLSIHAAVETDLASPKILCHLRIQHHEPTARQTALPRQRKLDQLTRTTIK